MEPIFTPLIKTTVALSILWLGFALGWFIIEAGRVLTILNFDLKERKMKCTKKL